MAASDERLKDVLCAIVRDMETLREQYKQDYTASSQWDRSEAYGAVRGVNNAMNILNSYLSLIPPDESAKEPA